VIASRGGDPTEFQLLRLGAACAPGRRAPLAQRLPDITDNRPLQSGRFGRCSAGVLLGFLPFGACSLGGGWLGGCDGHVDGREGLG
jgi:hypothetical protein